MIFKGFTSFFIFFIVLNSCKASLAQPDSVSIVTWNIFQRPDILNDQQKKRIQPTIEALLNTNADVLCLQEVFHKRSRKKLIKGLKEEYSYYKLGPNNKGKLLKTNSGLIIFVKKTEEIGMLMVFNDASKADALASKGVVGLYLKSYGFWVFNTHMQAGNTDENQAIRNLQYAQIKTELLNQIDKPYFFCGDFNTQFSDTTSISVLKNYLDVEIPEIINSNLEYSANFSDNGMFKTDSDATPEWIDFICLSLNQQYSCAKFEMSRPQKKWGNKTSFLSDHALVKGTYVLK